MNKNRIWFEHFLHKGMFVFTSGNNICSGWDCKGNRFENEFHYIDKRYKPVIDEDLIQDLNTKFG